MPEIRLIDAELSRVVDEAQSALIEADLGIYQRGGAIVRPISVEVPGADGRTTFSSRIALVSATHLAEMMTKTATFVKFDPRKKQWRAVACPPRIAETYVARMEWDLPVLTGTISAPTLRFDGTILCRPGYDPQTGLLVRSARSRISAGTRSSHAQRSQGRARSVDRTSALIPLRQCG